MTDDSDFTRHNEDVSILLVDDDPLILRAMERILSLDDYSYASAQDGVQAVEKLKESLYDIVITDINMPNMNGMELLKHIIRHHPGTGVIVSTGYSMEYSYIDVINAGAIDYMTKPFAADELLARLKRVVRERAMLKKLEQISVCDSLTKLYNRRYFDIKIVDETHRAIRHNYNIFLTFIDIDNFKIYNDTKGHQAGDYVLQTLGGIMTSCAARRGVDWTFRYGGDEFAVLNTKASKEQALQIIERIGAAYNEQKFGMTSLSFGLAKFQRDESMTWPDNINAFIKKADMAMYQAKERGKNQIFSAD
ncbi:MAG: diguanylate cyclase [Deltaproteobacteria bacterium]|nr:diguanylate cyclase [Deltaproteobacteria bacterium]